MRAEVLDVYPSFYAVIPATIRYDGELNELHKLLYGEISALIDKDGYCQASDGYFAKLFNKGEAWISNCIAALEKKGYIACIQKDIERKIKVQPSDKPFQVMINPNKNGQIKPNHENYSTGKAEVNKNIVKEILQKTYKALKKM